MFISRALSTVSISDSVHFQSSRPIYCIYLQNPGPSSVVWHHVFNLLLCNPPPSSAVSTYTEADWLCLFLYPPPSFIRHFNAMPSVNRLFSIRSSGNHFNAYFLMRQMRRNQELEELINLQITFVVIVCLTDSCATTYPHDLGEYTHKPVGHCTPNVVN